MSTSRCANQALCYHCHVEIPENTNLFVENAQGEALAMCCNGCKAVTEIILGLQLSQFYQFRDRSPKKSIDFDAKQLKQFTAFDSQEIKQTYINISPDKPVQANITLFIEGIHCAACVWLIENRLQQLPGLEQCQASLSDNQACVTWNSESLKLSDILLSISQLGYKPHLCAAGEAEKRNKIESRKALRRIGMSGLGAMQVMMMAVGLYAGELQGIEKQHQSFLQFCSMIVTLPIFFYVGAPFFKNAWRSLKNRHLGMDVPVTLALIVIFLQSISATLLNQGHVYYDSVCMFLFFLTLSRYLEVRARHKASEMLNQLNKLLPSTATKVKLQLDEIVEKICVPAVTLQYNDVVLVEPDQCFPADGRQLSDHGSINESMLTGEFLPKQKKRGDNLYAGTKNAGQAVLMQVLKSATQSRLTTITHLLSKAQNTRPETLSIANRVASWFVGFVLLMAALVGIGWHFYDPSQVINVMVAVLVISCPCALSLATPIALTVSMNSLARLGLLVLKNRVIEGFSEITHCVFDKTGTLTKGELELTEIIALSEHSQNEALQIAACLEQNSEHPIAQSIVSHAHKQDLTALKNFTNIKETLHQGIEGRINDKIYRIGKISFAKQSYAKNIALPDSKKHFIPILLANDTGPVAMLYFSDSLRPKAKETIDWLKQQNITPIILSGDDSLAVKNTAEQLEIAEYHQNQTPYQKQLFIKQLHNQNKKVLMVGDGANDVLAMTSADLSFAMGAGVDLTKTNSDAVLLNNDIALLKKIYVQTARAKKVITQNIAWALLYNVFALPLAALGMVAPYIAVVGMSMSSLVVTLNALRLRKIKGG